MTLPSTHPVQLARSVSVLVAAITASAPLAAQEKPARAADPAAQRATRPGSAPAGDDAATAWPSFRGRFARGVADGYPTPVRWNVESGKNVLWKTRIAGLSHSSPIVWGNRIFLTTAVREGDAELKVGLYGSINPVEGEGKHDFQVLCIDRSDGTIRWKRTAWSGEPKIKRHPKGSHAASTPATDGKHVAAFFGSEGLYVYDIDGEKLWQKDLGVLDSGFFMVKSAQWGFASSPVIHAGRVYVQCDVQGQSFVAAFDVATGEQVWRTDRQEECGWGTPTVHVTEDRRQLILNGWKHIGAYDLDTGEELWKLQGGGDIPVPTPVVGHGMAFITNAHGRMAPILAVSTAAEGTLKMSAEDCEDMIWSSRRGGAYMQTPIVYGDYLYVCRDNGSLQCLDAKTGERVYRHRVGSGRTGYGYTASAVAADGKLYFPSEEGEIHVVKAGPEYELLAVNDMGETCMATPAVSRGTLYIRARHHLFAVGKRDEPAPQAERKQQQQQQKKKKKKKHQ